MNHRLIGSHSEGDYEAEVTPAAGLKIALVLLFL